MNAEAAEAIENDIFITFMFFMVKKDFLCGLVREMVLMVLHKGVQIVQNGERPLCGSGKREKGPSGKYETRKDLTDLPDFPVLPEILCRPGVQNERAGCPKLGWTIENGKLKVENEKTQNIMFNGSLNPRSGCPK